MSATILSLLKPSALLASIQQWLITPTHHHPAQPLYANIENTQQIPQTKPVNYLSEQFPALCHALGNPLFCKLAQLYLQACPSDSASLYKLGQRFPAYLLSTLSQQLKNQAGPTTWISFICDLASFELQLFSLCDAPGAESQALATLQTPNDALRLQPSFALGEYQFDVASYYHQVRQQQQPKLPDSAHTCVAFVRKDYLTHTLPISPAQHQFLQLLQQGMDVESALLHIATARNIGVTQLQNTWNRAQGTREQWIGMGMFVDGR